MVRHISTSISCRWDSAVSTLGVPCLVLSIESKASRSSASLSVRQITKNVHGSHFWRLPCTFICNTDRVVCFVVHRGYLKRPPCTIILLPAVEWHAGGLHAYLFANSCKNFLVCLTSFLCLACDKVKVRNGVVEYLVNKVHDELHVLLYESA